MSDFVSERLVDRLVGDDTDFDDLDVVEELFLALTADLHVPAESPTADFLASLVAAVPEPEPRRTGRALRLAIVSGAVFIGAAGVAAASTGSLPGSIQSAVHSVVGVVGIHIPDGHGPPTTGGSQDGPGHGRSDEAPGRPDDPGQPADPGRSDEAPGQPEDPGSNGVGPEVTVPSGQPEDPGSQGVGPEDSVPPGSVPPRQPDDPASNGVGSSNAGGGNPNAGGANAAAGGATGAGSGGASGAHTTAHAAGDG